MSSDHAPLVSLENWGVDQGPAGEPVLILALQNAGTVIVRMSHAEAREIAQALAATLPPGSH
jgi:hypothetical protein